MSVGNELLTQRGALPLPGFAFESGKESTLFISLENLLQHGLGPLPSIVAAHNVAANPDGTVERVFRGAAGVPTASLGRDLLRGDVVEDKNVITQVTQLSNVSTKPTNVVLVASDPSGALTSAEIGLEDALFQFALGYSNGASRPLMRHVATPTPATEIVNNLAQFLQGTGAKLMITNTSNVKDFAKGTPKLGSAAAYKKAVSALEKQLPDEVATARGLLQ